MRRELPENGAPHRLIAKGSSVQQYYSLIRGVAELRPPPPSMCCTALPLCGFVLSPHVDGFAQVVNHTFDFEAREAVVEREGDGAIRDVFGDRKIAALETVV